MELITITDMSGDDRGYKSMYSGVRAIQASLRDAFGDATITGI
jgi:hypothetical protein